MCYSPNLITKNKYIIILAILTTDNTSFRKAMSHEMLEGMSKGENNVGLCGARMAGRGQQDSLLSSNSPGCIHMCWQEHREESWEETENKSIIGKWQGGAEDRDNRERGWNKVFN